MTKLGNYVVNSKKINDNISNKNKNKDYNYKLINKVIELKSPFI